MTGALMSATSGVTAATPAEIDSVRQGRSWPGGARIEGLARPLILFGKPVAREIGFLTTEEE